MPPHAHPHSGLQPGMLLVLIAPLLQPRQLVLQTVILARIANVLLQLIYQLIVLNLLSQLFNDVVFDGNVNQQFLVLSQCLETLLVSRVLEVHGDALNLL